MELDKLKQWMDLAQKMDTGDFWKGLFDSPAGTEVNGSPANGAAARREKKETFPKVDLYQRGPENWVVIELPGLYKQDVELSLSGQALTIRGIVKPPLDNATPLQTERFYGPFERTVPLPQLGDLSQVTARFEQGLLYVRYLRVQRQDEQIWIE
ncbi:Hsp20/alpha crystallin family protein [Paenibacillus cremeus]|uniref:Hsp20/alpha crystallin family protein n=1 Tax=Paenibacillus cremeus TaxID=2163881 RepID=A0A559KDR7_9BACL|nr:Hsp20/alpha crystallin family protein [Paenibacillus cremeus]TVY10258.1 Hsp20/alpha crystallin family protein [Paenibacillus cremeus]